MNWARSRMGEGSGAGPGVRCLAQPCSTTGETKGAPLFIWKLINGTLPPTSEHRKGAGVESGRGAGGGICLEEERKLTVPPPPAPAVPTAGSKTE